jgi:hypothetical protein
MAIIPIEGAPSKRFAVYRCDHDGNPYERIAEYDTPAELRAHRWRLDYRYKILIGAKFYNRADADKIIGDKC